MAMEEPIRGSVDAGGSMELDDGPAIRRALAASDAALAAAVERFGGGSWDSLTDAERDWIEDIADRAFADAYLDMEVEP